METTAYEQGYDAAKYSNAENPYEVDTEELMIGMKDIIHIKLK